MTGTSATRASYRYTASLTGFRVGFHKAPLLCGPERAEVDGRVAKAEPMEAQLVAPECVADSLRNMLCVACHCNTDCTPVCLSLSVCVCVCVNTIVHTHCGW